VALLVTSWGIRGKCAILTALDSWGQSRFVGGTFAKENRKAATR
jgi:hypothetical protein